MTLRILFGVDVAQNLLPRNYLGELFPLKRAPQISFFLAQKPTCPPMILNLGNWAPPPPPPPSTPLPFPSPPLSFKTTASEPSVGRNRSKGNDHIAKSESGLKTSMTSLNLCATVCLTRAALLHVTFYRRVCMRNEEYPFKRFQHN